MIPPTKTIIDDPDAEAAVDPAAPMTGEQATKLRALCEEMGESYDGNLTEQQAQERIETLEARRA